jgi:beta-lactamase regulating signal transducer with metallopeptidase domain
MMWLCVPLTLLSAYLLVAPVAAILSAIFPRAVDLNSIGRNSNAHGAAGLLGMLCFLAAGAPGMGITLAVARALGRPALAPVALLLWTALCLGISLLLFRAAEAVFERRRENLGLTSARPPS